MVLQSKQTCQINAISNQKITYSSEDDFYATVSDSGMVTAGKVGSTRIKLNNGIDERFIKVTTVGTNHLYPDPIMEFGTSQSAIISKLGSPAYQASSGTSTAIRYDNAPAATLGTIYYFTDDKLVLIATRVTSDYTELLCDYLLERFASIGQLDGVFYFANSYIESKITIAVALSLYSSDYWDVQYISYTPDSKAVPSFKMNALISSCFLKQ